MRTAELLVTALLVTIVVLAPSSMAAQDDVVAFGDSITEGPFPFDEDNKGGYPSRLQALLRDAGMKGIVVFNEGKSSEKTAGGLTRIDGVIQKHRKQAGVFIIMEGTNDVTRAALGEVSLETSLQNIEAMASKVRAAAIDVLYSTIIPRPTWAKLDRSNSLTYGLIFDLRDLTSNGNREMAYVYHVYENQGAGLFKEYYFCCDPVGHPQGKGFDLLAEIFADRILGEDTLAPVISGFSKSGDTDAKAGDSLFAILHESGEGILQEATDFTLNGRPVEATQEGSRRRLQLEYTLKSEDIGCAGRVTIRTEDRAKPANAFNRIVAELPVLGARQLKGDVSGDCKVNGFDLSLFGPSFGKFRNEAGYSRFADTNGDGQVDGDDLAKLAKNFGKDSRPKNNS